MADPDITDVVDDVPDAAIALRRPDVPATLAELAALRGGAGEVIEARIQILSTVRKAAIRATNPQDWLLFKTRDGMVTGYLQDAGCNRVRDLWGIEVFDVSRPEKVQGGEAGEFHYLVTGSGRCKLTGQVIEAIEGGRSSREDFCNGKAGVDLELAVRKAARANLDGNITRKLAGLQSVPLSELDSAWAGTTKKTDHCTRGRGFGSQDERLGATRAGEPDVEPPVCRVCGTKGAYREGRNGRGAFYGCPNYQKHADKKWTVDAAEWIAEQQKKAQTSAAEREPGQEG